MACLQQFMHVLYLSFCLPFSVRPLLVLHLITYRTLDEESVRQRPPQETDIHVPGRILTRNSSTRTAADPRVRPCGHRNRPSTRLWYENSTLGAPKGKHVTALTAAWHRLMLRRIARNQRVRGPLRKGSRATACTPLNQASVVLRRVAIFTGSSSGRCEDPEWFEQDILPQFYCHTDESIGRNLRGASAPPVFFIYF